MYEHSQTPVREGPKTAEIFAVLQYTPSQVQFHCHEEGQLCQQSLLSETFIEYLPDFNYKT
jgi:hypothetical protein